MPIEIGGARQSLAARQTDGHETDNVHRLGMPRATEQCFMFNYEFISERSKVYLSVLNSVSDNVCACRSQLR